MTHIYQQAFVPITIFLAVVIGIAVVSVLAVILIETLNDNESDGENKDGSYSDGK